MKIIFCCAIASTASLFASTASSCDLPVPFEYVYQNDVTASLAGGPCALSASTTAASRTAAAAFFHYRRATPLASVRYGFRFDDSALSSGNGLQIIQLLAATSPAIAMSPPTSSVLTLQLHLGSPPRLVFIAADANQPGGQSAAVNLSTSSTTVRVEINVGAAGNVKYWINHSFSDPPDGILETTTGSGLDNSALLGVIGAEIGLSNPSSNFRANHSGESVVFDQIESTDDVLFYDDFSSGAQ